MAEQNLLRLQNLRNTLYESTKAAISLTGYENQDADKYRKLSQMSINDLSDYKYRDVCRKAFYLWQRNPMAKRILEIFTDFCTDNLSVEIKVMKYNENGENIDTGRKDAQKIFDDCWNHPVNKLNDKFNELVNDLFMNGELLLPVKVNPTNGFVQIGYFPIKDGFVESTAYENNTMIIDTVKVNESDGINIRERVYKVIRINFDGNPETNPLYGKYQGDAFYFQINKLPSQMRGYSIIMELIDWLDAFDNFLFGVLDGYDARDDYWYDVTLTGYDEKKIANLKLERPKRGSMHLHNEKCEIKPMCPDLKASDRSEAMKMFRKFIVGTKGFPDMWFGEGDTTNRSTAEQMTAPTMMMLKRIQGWIKNMVHTIADYIVQQAIGRGLYLAPDEYVKINVSLYSLDRKDTETAGSGFSQFVTALVVAAGKGWVSDETAKKVVDGFLRSIGIEVDSSESVETIKAKNKERELEESLSEKKPELGD